MKASFKLPENNIKASFSIPTGGGTYDYERLRNKPSINDVELIGNKTSEELGLASIGDISDLTDRVTVNSSDITIIQNTLNTFGDIVTYNASDFASANQGALADTAIQPNDNITLLNNNAGFITNAVNDLTNYYLKSETYTKTEVQQLIASIPQFSVEVVQSLPVTGERMVLYLVPKDGEAPDVYNEYIWVEDENEFELLGSTAVDLTGYATETYVDTGLATKVSKSGDSMTGNLITSGAIYLTSVSNSVHAGASKIYFGSVNSPTNYISANSGGAFGIYNNNRQGITCYPTQNLFPDATSGTIDLGRSANKWKNLYISGTLYGASSNIAITDLISGATAGNTAVQPADLANYQPLLVSGTNIKTINNETVLGSGNINIQSSTVAFGTSSTAGNVAEKEVSIPEITELNVGQILYIKPSASATVANLTIKLNNFTAYPIRYNNGAITTSTDDLVWSQNFVSQFIFDGTYWQFAGRGYDKDSTYTQNILFDRGNFVSGSGTYAITRYSICLQKPDMTFEKVTNTEENFSLANDKTVNTHGFLLNGEMLYYSNTTVLANGAYSSSNTMYRQNSGFDIRYSMNTTGTGYTTGDCIYFVGTIGVDGLFYLDTTQWWTNTLPNTNDGKIYVKIGKYVSGVTVTLELEHPAYYHDGTKICVYQSAGNKQDTLVSGTNIKTINNQSLLGSGNIIISGGGGGAVDSVNGQTGVVVLTASDVGALATTDVTEYTAQEVETLWGSI